MIDFGHAGALRSILGSHTQTFQSQVLDALAQKDLDVLSKLEKTVPEIAVLKNAYGDLDTVFSSCESEKSTGGLC